MSSLTAERLYKLLPAVYRVRDAQQGEPLRALLALIAQRARARSRRTSISSTTTSSSRPATTGSRPYIGDLIGYRPLHGVAAAIASPRAEVANTIAYRRRKGTAAMLEQLARDVTGWPARAVEFFEQLATTQYMNHVRLHAPATAAAIDAADAPAAAARSTRCAHRRDAPARSGFRSLQHPERRHLPVAVAAVPPEQHSAHAGSRATRPGAGSASTLSAPTSRSFDCRSPRRMISHIAEPANVPDPINLRLMARGDEGRGASIPTIHDDYGDGDSILLLTPDRESRECRRCRSTSPDISVCDLA